MTDAFDEKALMDGIDGDIEFLQETVIMFNEDTPSPLERIEPANNAPFPYVGSVVIYISRIWI